MGGKTSPNPSRIASAARMYSCVVEKSSCPARYLIFRWSSPRTTIQMIPVARRSWKRICWRVASLARRSTASPLRSKRSTPTGSDQFPLAPQRRPVACAAIGAAFEQRGCDAHTPRMQLSQTCRWIVRAEDRECRAEDAEDAETSFPPDHARPKKLSSRKKPRWGRPARAPPLCALRVLCAKFPSSTASGTRRLSIDGASPGSLTSRPSSARSGADGQLLGHHAALLRGHACFAASLQDSIDRPAPEVGNCMKRLNTKDDWKSSNYTVSVGTGGTEPTYMDSIDAHLNVAPRAAAQEVTCHTRKTRIRSRSCPVPPVEPCCPVARVHSSGTSCPAEWTSANAKRA